MKKVYKRILLFFLFNLFIGGCYIGYRYYSHMKEKKRRAVYYENLVDTSSPTVTVLRDSILIDYLDEKRTVHIYVPPSYFRDSTSRYPVIYLMDGESAFNDLETMGPEWQVDEVINRADSMGKASSIVVAINQAEDRDAEYTPFINEDNPDAHGADYTRWLATDLKSWVDSSYRTKPQASYTAIGGISRSGMMAYYIMMAEPEVFGMAIIQSPSMWVDYDKLMAMELSEEQLKNKKIFISVGAKEGMIMVPHAKKLYKKFEDLGLGENQLKLEIIPKEGHWHVTWRKSFALAYPWLMEING